MIATNFQVLASEYLMQNTSILFVGGKVSGKQKEGVKCTLNDSGVASCLYY